MTDTALHAVLSGADTSVRPQDDLFRAVNGTWLREKEIPADQVSVGSFIDLRDEAELHVRELIEKAADAAGATPSETAADSAPGVPAESLAKVVALYRSFIDTAAINEKGTAPLAADLDPVASAKTKEDLARVIGALMRTGVNSFFGVDVAPSLANPNVNEFSIGQSGLGLPDEAYYREAQFAPMLDAYREFVPQLAQLAFDETATQPSPAITAAAGRVIEVETKLAAAHMSRTDARDMDKVNNPMSFADFVASAPQFPWATALRAIGYDPDGLGTIIVTTPQALQAAAQLWEETPLETLQEYTRWRILLARASYLPEVIDAKNFDFYGKVLAGTTQQRDRWKRAVQLVNGVLGEAVGQLYVASYFPPEHKATMDQLVADLLDAYRLSIRGLDWMSDATKERALAKLDTFAPKIGYPDKWKDYSSMQIGTDLLANIRAACEFEVEENIAKLGKEVDRSEWHMNPQTVNAYYNPQWNEIVFPAAILQWPFFEQDRDAAFNYGGIGAGIGHEIGHGFDDQGSKFDADGSLNNWWTDEDRAEFEKRTAALIAQFNSYIPAQLNGDEAFHVNGELTQGENIGDLGGLSIALKAYEIHLEREGLTLETAPVIDGYTGAQRVFLSFAKIWQGKNRDEWARQLIAIDPHSPSEFRCNGTVKNIDAFAQAFGLEEGDGLYLAPEERVRIW
ncbi:M13-type metalloendopeptidase [Actinotignum timonense]|uniref:M13 family metallopeptidase n=1 Tax=Actinotignum timonense TaxID=1870995 RepID=UPI002A82909F|nr:M13-type metalloendopeptidase [Actinotignum timonense]MDY5138199.1 M13-type metalloendopeptidase [Actinotignum timonense]